MSFGTYTPRFYPVGDADKYPSVTTILSVLDKPALLPWVAKCVVEYVKQNAVTIGPIDDNSVGKCSVSRLINVLDNAKKHYRTVSKKACDIGTAVHGAVEYYLKGATPEDAVSMALTNVETEEGADVTDDFIAKVQAGFDAFVAWANEHDLEPVALEVAMYNHEFRYAGRVDFVGHVDGVLTLIDFKTSKGFYDEYAMQTAAYRDCIPDVDTFDPLDIVAHGVLRLDKETGKPYYKDYSDFFGIDLEMFQTLARFYNLSLHRKKIAAELKALKKKGAA